LRCHGYGSRFDVRNWTPTAPPVGVKCAISEPVCQPSSDENAVGVLALESSERSAKEHPWSCYRVEVAVEVDLVVSSCNSDVAASLPIVHLDLIVRDCGPAIAWLRIRDLNYAA